MKLTAEQEAIILDNESSTILVSASAGTGKTTLMIEKILKLIEDKSKNITLDDIVFIAFNKSVADEIKVKLANKITEKILANQDDRELVVKLRNELDKIYNGNFETIDSYALKTLKSFSSVSEHITSEIAVTENMDDLIKKEIKIGVDSKFSEQFPDKYKNIKKMSGWYNLNYYEIIEKIIQMSAKQYDVDGWIVGLKFNHKDEIVEEYIRLTLNRILGNISILSQKISRIEDIYEYLKTEFAKVNKANYEDRLCKIKNDIISSKNDLKVDKEINKRFDAIEQEIENLRLIISEVIHEDLEQSNYVADITEVAVFCLRQIRNKKIDKQEFEFSDITYFCNKLFVENPALRQEVQDKIKYLMIDEAQDLSRLQHHFIELIGEKARKIYVGDEKQSIYAFRDADPKYFLRIKQDIIENRLKGKVYYISKNFRSQANLLEYVNKQMSIQMKNELSDIEYSRDGKFNLTEKETIGELRHIVFKNSKSRDVKVNNFCSAILKDLKEKYGNPKEIDFSKIKIGIIAEKNKILNDVAACFKNLEIPTTIVKSKKKIKDAFYDVYMLIILFVLPYDNAAFLYFLLNGYFKLDRNKILNLSKQMQQDQVSQKGGTFFSYLINNEFLECRELMGFSEKYFEIISEIRELTALEFLNKISKSVKEFIIFANNDLTWKLLEAIDNFKKYIVEEDVITISEMIKIFSNEKEIEEKQNTNRAGIQFYTIHTSKGLEWDNVYLLLENANKSFNIDEKYLISNDYGMLIKDDDKNQAIYKMLKKLDDAVLIKENYRKLYVALTRAKKSMTVLLAYKDVRIGTNLDNETLFYPYSVSCLMNEYYSLFLEKNIIDNFEDIATNEDSDKEQITIDSLLKLYTKDELESLKKISDTNLKYRYTVTEINERSAKKIKVSEEGDLYKEDALMGTMYHQIFENINFDLYKEKENEIIINQIMNTYKCAENKEVVNNVFAAIEGDLGFIVRNAKKVYRELEFSMYEKAKNILENEKAENKIILRGKIDLFLVDSSGQNIIVDYKLSGKSDLEIKNTYQKQLLLYKDAIESRGEYTIDKLFIYSILKNKLIEV